MNKFTYIQKQGWVHYSRTPVGRLAVNELIAGKPCWIPPTLPSIEKQKTLILSDWSAQNWSSEKTAEVKKALGELMSQGYSIYVFRNGEVSTLQQDDLLRLDKTNLSLNDSFLTVKDVSIAAMAQHKLTMDEIQVIDDYWVEQIASGSEALTHRVLRTSEMQYLNEVELDQLLQLIHASKPPLSQIIHDCFSKKTNAIVAKLKEKWPKVDVHIQYTEAYLENGTTLDETRNLKNGDFVLDETALQQLKSIELVTPSEEVLFFTLMHASSLKNIILDKCKTLREIDFSEINLDKIEDIRVHAGALSSSQLKCILSKSKYLKKITFNYSKLIEIDFSSINLDKLEEIELSNTISSSQLQCILSQSKNLKKISLNKYEELGEIDFYDINLDKLEEIKLSLSTISPSHLQCMLSHSKNLKKISLNIYTKFREIDFSDIELDKLEEIDLTASPISSSQLQCILSKSKNLKKISLNKYEELGEIDFSGIDLDKLEEIKLSASNISPSHLQCIFSQSKNLKKISLQNYTNLKEIDFSDIDLDKLEEIDLFLSPISSSQLQCILNQSKNLKRISLNRDANLSEIDFTAVHLEHLREIKPIDNSMSLEKLQYILSAAPQLDAQSKSDIEHEIKIRTPTSSVHPTPTHTRPNESDTTAHTKDSSVPTNPIHDPSAMETIKPNTTSAADTSPNASDTTTYSTDSFIPTNPIHDPSAMKTIKPNTTYTPYDFKKLQTKNQGMIIGKLCHYWEKNNLHLALIPRIQDGICLVLSHYFLKLTPSAWDTFITEALEWNGEAPVSLSLQQHFDDLSALIKTVEFGAQLKTQFLGDDLTAFLMTQKTACILFNPWHAITIRPIRDNLWQIYDPNYVTGFLTVNKEDLLEQLKRSIGTLVSIESNKALSTFTLHSPNDFIEHGGLLTLCQCENVDAILSLLPKEHLYSKEALGGIFLRDNSGKPAWLLGLESGHESVRALTTQLKHQFESMNPKDSAQAFAASLEALTPLQKHDSITEVIRTSPLDPLHQATSQNDLLIELIRTSANKAQYEKQLKTWDITPPFAPNPLAYCQHALTDDAQKRLIQFDSTEDLEQLRLQLQETAGHLARPVFYVDKPEDLICQAPWMEKFEDGTGKVHKGPGGPLYDFLMANSGKAPLILVNYEQFNADDLVRLNGLLDKAPLADGIPLPEKTMIIGLMNRNKPDCYQGSDFYSRFNCNERCPLTHEQLCSTPMKTTVSAVDVSDASVISLYHAPDWEDSLLGRWVLDGNDLTFKEGALLQAINAGKPIELRHAPWGNQDFERFLKQLMNGGVRHGSRTIKLPEHIPLIRPKTDDYVWASIPTIHVDKAPPTNAKILNSTTLGDFLGRYEFKDNTLQQRPGWIKDAAQGNGLLAVQVTRTLSDDAWAMLLHECNRLKVNLTVYPAPGVELPTAFHHKMIQSTSKEGVPINESCDCMVTSTDVDTSVALLLKKKSKAVVIDVSECTSADLLVKLDGTLNPETLHFKFSRTEGALIKALRDNQTVILKGRFSPELFDALAPLFKEREVSPSLGQLVLVTEENKSSKYIANRYTHDVSNKDKLSCLPFDDTITKHLDAYLAHESLSRLYARAIFLKTHPEKTNSDDAWCAMHRITEGIKAPLPISDISQRQAITTECNNQRRQQINAVLSSSPYVFISGLSGVGKSTFVEKEFCQKNDTLYLTETRIAEWAGDLSDKRKILFIDEANLINRQWSEFEGLFQTPPNVLIDGKLYPLTENHKVIFAGNPIHYGDERQLAPFFERHGNAVLFTPLPPEYIDTTILRPVFNDSAFDTEPVINRILDIYRFICDCSTTEVLITPRELQMMALLTQSWAKAHPEGDIIARVEQLSYDLAKNLVPKSKQDAFDKQFKPQHIAAMKPLLAHETHQRILITPSRQLLSEKLNDLLDLRQWRGLDESALNTAQKAGGLGGIIIEGEPGIGKSELVIETLRARNYIEMKDWRKPATHDAVFYIMPVSLSVSEKEDLLIKAFQEGAVVMIDEINSSPMMERLLNDLLMGKNPKGSPDDPIKPGFMVIGTQNPVTMAGRRMASTALQRRLMMSTLPEYNKDEMKTILLAKGIDAIDADAMIDAYETNRAYAIKNQLSPVPNFRNLIHLAQWNLKSKEHLAPVHKTVEKTDKADETSTNKAPESPLTSYSDKLKSLRDYKNRYQSIVHLSTPLYFEKPTTPTHEQYLVFDEVKQEMAYYNGDSYMAVHIKEFVLCKDLIDRLRETQAALEGNTNKNEINSVYLDDQQLDELLDLGHLRDDLGMNNVKLH